jgi:pyruvate dehydrogenase complex dehydrogenase (E1) component
MVQTIADLTITFLLGSLVDQFDLFEPKGAAAQEAPVIELPRTITEGVTLG